MKTEDVGKRMGIKTQGGMTARAAMNRGWLSALLLIMLAMGMAPAQAFMLGSTRVVLPEGQAVPVQIISGEGDGVLLIRARVTANLSDKNAVKGVVVSPPLLRLDKGLTGIMRLQAVALAGLPLDRESVMYLSVVGMPSSNPLSADAGKVSSSMVVSTGIQEKVFYRPHGMSGLVAAPWKTMTITRVPGGVKVSNVSPFHLTFSRLNIDGHSVALGGNQPTMIPPFGSQVYGTKSVAKKTLDWVALNDLGGDEKGSTAVQ
ncbi:molecular chaperone [Serratia fonticola]|uniref:fimbrial biogenesis chaperone n=1 Tax=Serratia fonticola TaxID=47917 RepID=UPI001644BE27|nr:molecular chaperone [Serratia fonticola]MBC3252329.1 molecular chaperone [Serratia fonticola]